MKLYNMVAVHKNSVGKTVATRITEGYLDRLNVDLADCPPGTFRIAVMEKKQFDQLLASQPEDKSHESSEHHEIKKTV
jgi:hypothetical protein